MTKAPLALAAVAGVLAYAAATLAQGSKNSLVPPPPGSVVQTRLVHLSGDVTNGQWEAIVSKKLVGSANGQNFYQWYLSIYSLRANAYRLRYQSPRNGGPLSHVEQASGGAKMWFPAQTARIAGAGELMRPGVQQVVVQSHETGADCGSATVTVFAGAPGGSAAPAVSVGNPCDLNAAIASDETSILLSGPYYAGNAPLCCPTKPNASAVLRYENGKWVESPNYYKLYVGHVPPK